MVRSESQPPRHDLFTGQVRAPKIDIKAA